MPAYIVPEVLLKKEYDGKMANVWSCGVMLYVMLVGAYPFEDPEEPKIFRKTIQRILNFSTRFRSYVHISTGCCQLMSKIFVADPAKNLPGDLVNENAVDQFGGTDQPTQSVDEIMQMMTWMRTWRVIQTLILTAAGRLYTRCEFVYIYVVVVDHHIYATKDLESKMGVK
ncbi:putative protein kinase CAMK-OST1L family [Helianthus annuus]|nr:putative protein kinase CAMK-OST1L family [Helianthus annuus]